MENFFAILCYNLIMDYVNVVTEAFWQYHIAFAGSLAAVIAVKFIFSFVNRRLR